MPAWAKLVFRAIGVLNLGMVAVGIYWLLSAVARIAFRPVHESSQPYFGLAFTVMTSINLAFLWVFLVTAIHFVRLRLSAVRPYSIAMAALVAYSVLTGMLWTLGNGAGISIAAASGVGNMGVALFELLLVVPYAYPILSVVLLIVTRQRVAKNALPAQSLG